MVKPHSDDNTGKQWYTRPAKTIYVSDSKATLHEFGHFCQSVVGRTEAFKAIYDKEAKKALPLLREYSLTNSNEYFADCFQYWIAHAADANKLEALRSAARRPMLTLKSYQQMVG